MLGKARLSGYLSGRRERVDILRNKICNVTWVFVQFGLSNNAE
jgi:hypothetical protein